MGIELIATISWLPGWINWLLDPANLLVMGPGGYRFSDYIKIGLPLTLVILVVVILVMPIFWPF